MVVKILAILAISYAVVIPAIVAAYLPLLTIKRAGPAGAFKLDLTFLTWWYTYPPLILISAVVVPCKLAAGWEGYDSLFGNYKYGRYGNKAAPSKNVFDEWVFLVLRNPLSNFGKQTLAARSTASWPWHYDIQLAGRLWLKAGWKEVKDPVANPERTFVFRPYFKRG